VAHKFDATNKNKLDSEERIRLLAPYETLEKLGYKKGYALADIGCGTGLFTIPAAQICGEDAIIYGVDVSEEMLLEVEKRAVEAGFNNIQAVKSDEYDFKLNDEAVNFVLICIVLHEIDDKIRFLREAARVCKAGGIIAIIEFSETNTGFGPPLDHRLPRNLVLELLDGEGFTNVSEMAISEAFYGVTAKKEVQMNTGIIV
jgi:ubiquinone/menaquinone biosynthesis C-methylase UbiE